MDFSKKYKLDLKAGEDYSVKENHRLPAKLGAEIFVFGKVMYCKGKLSEIPKHEYLHIAQFRKYGILLVMMHYNFFVFVNIIRFWNFKKAYMMVPFEVEARKYEGVSEN